MPTWPEWMTDTRCLRIICVGLVGLTPPEATTLVLPIVAAGLIVTGLGMAAVIVSTSSG